MMGPATNALRAGEPTTDGVVLSIVVPVFEMGPHVRETVRRLQAFRATQTCLSELIVVDDGSTTPVADLVAGHDLDLDGVRFLRLDRNRGKGHAVAHGMASARGHYRVFLDADLAYAPSQIARIVTALRSGADVAIASRRHRDSRAVWVDASGSRVGSRRLRMDSRYLVGRLFNMMVRLAVVRGFADTQAGLKGFSARASEIVFGRLSVPRFAFDVEALVIARRHALRIAETAVIFRVGDPGTTVAWGRDTLRMLRDLAAVRWRAMRGQYD